MTAYMETLAVSRQRPSLLPEAPSPRHMGIRDLQSRDLSSSDSDYPPSRYEDLKVGNMPSLDDFVAPREAPKPQQGGFGTNGGLPMISRPAPGQAEAGIGGAPVQGQLFPPLRSQTAPAREIQRSDSQGQNKQKRGLFGGKGPAANVTVGKLNISNPIIQEVDGGQNPLAKIATIDLATAAKNERERRDMALQRSSSLMATRPAPQPPVVSPEEAMKRAQSFKRKQVASTASQPTEPEPELQLMPTPAAATTTSAQLSPGVEEIRRRSPRQPPPALVERPVETRPITPPREPEQPRVITPPEPSRTITPPAPVAAVAAAAAPRSISPPRANPQPSSPPSNPTPAQFMRQGSVKTTIRPSRQRPRSPQAIPEEDQPSKTPLQRRPTTGLPSNPRAQAMKKLNAETAVQKEQTVMFINNIQYNDPTTVESIIQDAADMAARQPELKKTNSVVNRPRPIPRKPDKDRQIFPAEPSPNQHKRTKSGGSISRKSILRSNPGSPTQLPPLPPPPMSAGNPLRPLPNDTKSMTFDEKMNLFYADPSSAPSSATTLNKRRSQIPDMPPIPPFLNDDGEMLDRSERSNRSTKTSIRTGDVLEIDEMPSRRDDRNISKFSEDTYRHLADEVGQSWLPGFESGGRNQPRPSYDGTKRQSSPVLPSRMPSISTTVSDARTRDDEVTTNWGSVHSPEAAVNVRVARAVPKATYIQKRESADVEGGEVMTFMLDSSIPHNRDVERESIYVDSSVPLPTMPRGGHDKRESQWHRRVGDNCPTFSDRKEKIRSRKMPPPTPLLLGNKVLKNTVIVPAPEPSPLESPQEAYQKIQAQLMKLDEPSRDSVGSEGQRLALLENLENEMGMQENRWHEMQHDMSRDSLSTIKTTSPHHESHAEDASHAALSREASQRSIAADRRASRRARMRSGTVSKGIFEEATSPSSQLAEGSQKRGGAQQQRRLLDAQNGIEGNARDPQSKRNLNFLTLAQTQMQLGSPTPPDTDESDSESHIDSKLMRGKPSSQSPGQITKLWKPTSPSELVTPSTALLWSPAKASPFAKTPSDADLPEMSVRPAARKSSEPLASIESSDLWKKDTNKSRDSGNGLWGETSHQQQQRRRQPEQEQQSSKKAPRPVTQRPPRRSKRVTLLPDILESPQPLPDKRGTLGIFQFPWGEKSDTATVQQTRPSHMFMAMPGTMTSGGPAINAALNARARQLEAQEYSSSFFDDYDDEEDDSDVSDIEDGSDDGFDETTLWEIASLLKTDQVPSKNSLLPQGPYRGQATMVEEYISEMPSDEEDEDAKHDSIIVALDTDDFPLPPNTTALWAGKSHAKVAQNTGLPQPDDQTWKNYIPVASDIPRVQSRVVEPASIESSRLWSSPTKAESSMSSRLWSNPANPSSQGLFNPAHTHRRTSSREPAALDVIRKPRAAEEALPELTSFALWIPLSPNSRMEDVWTNGLFNHNPRRNNYRTTKEEPAAIHMVRKPRVFEEPLPVLSSHKLWSHSSNSSSVGQFTSRESVIPSSFAGLSRPTWWEPKQSRIPMQTTSKAHLEKVIAGSTKAQPIRRPFQPSAAVAPNWDAALQEAIAASYPTRMTRRAATPAEWDAALEDALSQTTKFDVTTRHPAFAGSSMATGYTYDPANVNPVFSGSLAITSENVDVTDSSYAAKKLRGDRSKRDVNRSDSRNRRKEDILAQIRAIENGEDISSPMAIESPVGSEEQNLSASRSASKRTVILAQIQALEQEKHRDASPNAAIPAPRLNSQLWSRPEGTVSVVAATSSMMWTPPQAKPAIVEPELPAAEIEDWEAEGMRRKRKDRKKEILAQIIAIENGADPASLGLGGSSDFSNQSMWSRTDSEMRQKNSRGRERDWLDDSVNQRFSKVQFVY
jgi:hypothetical protein